MTKPKSKTTTKKPAAKKPAAKATPATNSIIKCKIGDEIMIGNDKYRIAKKGKSKVTAIKLFTDDNGNTYGVSTDEFPGTTEVK